MEVTRKEMIVTICLDIILILIVFACLFVLKFSAVAMGLALISFVFILISLIMSYFSMRSLRKSHKDKK